MAVYQWDDTPLLPNEPVITTYEEVPLEQPMPYLREEMVRPMPYLDEVAKNEARVIALQGLALLIECQFHLRMKKEEQRLLEERQEEEEEREEVIKARKARRWWVRPMYVERLDHGQYHQLLAELEKSDVGSFKNFVRVNPKVFTEILNRIEEDISKEDTRMRKALEPALKLAITLRFLATGDSFASLKFAFRVAPSTICKLIAPVCEAIIDAFAPDYMAIPETQQEWRQIEEVFRNKWDLPHCLGAIDGKHVAIWCPSKSGSEYYNYKGFFSIVLMAVVDGNYKFININVGAKGAGSDGAVFSQIEFNHDMQNDLLDVPPAEPMPDGDPTKYVPHFFVGDEAFPLKTWLMKPLPKRNLTEAEAVYNFRISRARRVVENAFGILAARFRCLLRTLHLKPEKAVKVVIACCVLHNMLRTHNFGGPDPGTLLDREDPETHEVMPGLWRLETNMRPLTGRRGAYGDIPAKAVRQTLIEYLNGPGALDWVTDRLRDPVI